MRLLTSVSRSRSPMPADQPALLPANFPAASNPGSFDIPGQLLGLIERACATGSWSLALPERRPRLSANLADLLGLTPQAASSLARLSDFFTAESRAVVQSALDACILSGLPFDVEAQVVTASENHLMVRCVGEALRDAGGVPAARATRSRWRRRARSGPAVGREYQMTRCSTRLGNWLATGLAGVRASAIWSAKRW